MAMDTYGVYLSVDCQQRPYWDDTVADVNGVFCPNTEQHKINKATERQWDWEDSVFIVRSSNTSNHQRNKDAGSVYL